MASASSDAVVLEASAVASADFQANLFDPTPTDTRFMITSFAVNYMTNSLSTNAKEVKFELPALTANNIYMFHNSFLYIKAKITKADGSSSPDNYKTISVINDLLYTMWWNCEVKLNNVNITPHNDKYPFRTYLMHLLNYSDAKHAELQGQMWYSDTPGAFEDFSEQNVGFFGRQSRFVEKYENSSAKPIYRKESSPICGKLITDLSSYQGGIISGVKINVDLTHAPDEFRILTDDTEKYRLVVDECLLHTPIATLHPLQWTRIQERLEKEPTRILFKRVICKNHPIKANSLSHISDNIIDTRQLPSRIIIAFVPSESYRGSYKKNPLRFMRTFPIYGPEVFTPPPPPPPPPTLVEQALNYVLPSGSRGRGAATAGRKRGKPRAARGSGESTPSSVAQDVQDKVIKGYCYIKDVSLTCGGNRVDSLFCDNSQHDAVVDFMRLGFFTQHLDTPFSHAITYKEFCSDSFMCTFDMTTGQNSGLQFLVPTTRFGHLRLSVIFSEPLPIEVECLIFQEYPVELKIDKHRAIGFTYVETTAT
jgi:hypothetical protein